MPPLSCQSLLATVTAGAASSVAGCNALSRETTPDASRDGFGTTPLSVADGVPLPDGVDVTTVADQVRLVTSFDDRLQAAAPPAADTETLGVRRDMNSDEDTVEHRFRATTDETRQQFTACQHSLVTAPEPRDPFTYTANCRFRWRDPRFVREDDHWHHHTPGVAMWYPDGGR